MPTVLHSCAGQSQRHWAPWMSAAGVTLILFACACVAIPLALTLSVNGYWQTVSSWREQPLVSFSGDYIVTVSSGSSTAVNYASNSLFNLPAVGSSVPTVTFTENDVNGDGKMDMLTFQVKVNAQVPTQVQLALFVSYKLSQFLPLSMQAIVYLNAAQLPSDGNISAVMMNANLKMRQGSPFPSTTSQTKYYQPVISYSAAALDPTSYGWSSLLSTYFTRDYVTVANLDTDPLWTAGNTGTLTISGNLRYSQDSFLYSPSIAQNLKWLWIQLCALGILTIALLFPVYRSLIQGQFVATHISVPSKESTFHSRDTF